MSADTPLLTADGVKKHFDQSDGFLDRILGAGGTVRAVDGVDLELHEGETLAVVGESGCGKSTLGQTLLNLHAATDGSVQFRGNELTGLSDGEMRQYRRRMQMIFQDPLASLNPRQTVGDIVTAPMEVHDLPQSDPAVETTAEVTVEGAFAVDVSVDDDVDRVVAAREGVSAVGVTVRENDETETGYEATVDDESFAGALDATVESDDEPVRVTVSVTGSDDEVRLARAEALLERVGLKPAHVDRYPGQFSGGQQQRVGVARALSVNPELIVADEPVSALDVSVQAQILELLDDLQDELGLSILLITHDLSVVHQVADRVAVMYLGEIVETAPVRELFEDPQHPYTKSLLSAVPRIDPSARQDRVILEGTVPSPIDPPEGCRFHTRCPAVIPTDEWEGSQQSFRHAFTFRNRVEGGELDAEAIRNRLEAEGEPAGHEAVAERLVDGALPGDIEDLPASAAETIRTAAEQVAAGDEDDAVETVEAAFPSPCVDETPRTVKPAENRTAACHRVDPERAPEELL